MSFDPTFPREMLDDNPAGYDNIAALYVALGNKAKALEHVALCGEKGYESFDQMPAMPDYASIKDDPDFKKLFE